MSCDLCACIKLNSSLYTGTCTREVVHLPFLDLGEEIQGGDNLRIERDGRLFGIDDGISPAIELPSLLPLGNNLTRIAHVSIYVNNYYRVQLLYIAHRFLLMD